MPSRYWLVQLSVFQSLGPLHNPLNLLFTMNKSLREKLRVQDFQPCKLGFFMLPKVSPESTLVTLNKFWALKVYPGLDWRGHSHGLNPCNSTSFSAVRILFGLVQNKTLFSSYTVWYQKLPQVPVIMKTNF